MTMNPEGLSMSVEAAGVIEVHELRVDVGRLSELNQVERRTVILAASGYSDKEIADRTQSIETTVHRRMDRIRLRMGIARGRANMTLFAVAAGLIRVERASGPGGAGGAASPATV